MSKKVLNSYSVSAKVGREFKKWNYVPFGQLESFKRWLKSKYSNVSYINIYRRVIAGSGYEFRFERRDYLK